MRNETPVRSSLHLSWFVPLLFAAAFAAAGYYSGLGLRGIASADVFASPTAPTEVANTEKTNTSSGW